MNCEWRVKKWVRERRREKYSSSESKRKIKLYRRCRERKDTKVVETVMVVRSMKSVRVCLFHVSTTHWVYIYVCACVCICMSKRAWASRVKLVVAGWCMISSWLSCRSGRETKRKEKNGSTLTLVVSELVHIASTPLFALTLISLSHAITFLDVVAHTCVQLNSICLNVSDRWKV